jgi:hypothetical protein
MAVLLIHTFASGYKLVPVMNEQGLFWNLSANA